LQIIQQGTGADALELFSKREPFETLSFVEAFGVYIAGAWQPDAAAALPVLRGDSARWL
jgi:hypothetical protein